MKDAPFDLSRNQKALIVLLLDALLVPFALFLSLVLRLGVLLPLEYFPQANGLFLSLPLIGVILSWVMGIPNVVLRAFEQRAIWQLTRFVFVMSLICAGLNTFLSFGLPRSIPGIWAAVFLVFAVAARLLLANLGERLDRRGLTTKQVMIYGAGATGQQLAAALRADRDMRVMGFVDDNSALRRVTVAGLSVVMPAELPKVISQQNISQIILAMPTTTRRRRAEIVESLQPLGVEVMAVPSFLDMMDGRTLTDQIQPVTPDALLGRNAVDLAIPEVAQAYRGKTVMVTGAGGSIGSELVRQVVRAGPGRLVLYEQGELGLYTVEQHLRKITPLGCEVVPILGSVNDEARLARVLAQYDVQIVLHAAAYKHVPMVEANPLEGARNNILGTEALARMAAKAGVERFILVSTDKAVRPTNVMGATKRMAELVVQDAQTRADGIFAMVRFGNVLGSSGSVIPLFRDQIARGGPVTLTHKDITRYFMTIPEAAQLVLLAGSFAEGGEVFVLDMGTPVKIHDLARRMIELSGLTVRDETNPDGDIEIVVTGLRPGEKLYEELLIGENTVATPHPKIMRAKEGMLDQGEIAGVLDSIRRAVSDDSVDALKAVFHDRVDGFQSE